MLFSKIWWTDNTKKENYLKIVPETEITVRNYHSILNNDQQMEFNGSKMMFAYQK